MKAPQFLTLFTISLALHGNLPAEEGHAHAGAPNGVEYSAAKGLSLSKEVQKIVGLQEAEAAMESANSERILYAQVFREAGEQALNGRYRTGAAYAVALLTKDQMLAAGTSFSATAPGGVELAGTVQRVDKQLSGPLGEGEAILEIQDPNRILQIGADITLKLQTAGSQTEIVVPQEAVLKTAKGDFVYVKNGDAYIRAEVKTRPSTNGKTQILDGLFEGDVVVTRGASNLYLVELQAVNAGTGCTHGH